MTPSDTIDPLHVLANLVERQHCLYREGLQMPNELKNKGSARLLPSWRRHGSAGASPSRVMNRLDKVDEDMFTGVALTPSPHPFKHLCNCLMN